MNKHVHLIIVTDCGGSDEGRYRIAAERSFFPHSVTVTFFRTESMNTFHSGFTTAAHVLSTIRRFGPLRPGEFIGIIDNSAPRHGSENGERLRGENRKREGEKVFMLKLKSGECVVGPNAGWNFFFIQQDVEESFLVADTSNQYTPFRSMEVMVPALAKILADAEFPDIRLTSEVLTVGSGEKGVFVADWDSHGNIYLVSTIPDSDWVPPLGESRAFRIGNKIIRVRHVHGIFDGKTGEQTLTTGSLELNGRPIYYIVVVGGNAHSLVGNPPVGTKVEIEPE